MKKALLSFTLLLMVLVTLGTLIYAGYLCFVADNIQNSFSYTEVTTLILIPPVVFLSILELTSRIQSFRSMLPKPAEEGREHHIRSDSPIKYGLVLSIKLIEIISLAIIASVPIILVIALSPKSKFDALLLLAQLIH